MISKRNGSRSICSTDSRGNARFVFSKGSRVRGTVIGVCAALLGMSVSVFGSSVAGATAPTITTTAATALSATQATMNGTLGATTDTMTTEQFCYSDTSFTSGNCNSLSSHVLESANSNGSGAWSAPLSSLTPGSTYWVEFEATDSTTNTTLYGGVVSFTTLAAVSGITLNMSGTGPSTYAATLDSATSTPTTSNWTVVVPQDTSTTQLLAHYTMTSATVGLSGVDTATTSIPVTITGTGISGTQPYGTLSLATSTWTLTPGFTQSFETLGTWVLSASVPNSSGLITALSLTLTVSNLTAIGGGGSGASGSVTPGSPAAVHVTTQPSPSATDGVALATQPVVTIVDANGTPVPGVIVTVSTSGGITLSGASATTDSAGVATFSNLTLTGTLGNYVLTFTAGSGGPTATSSEVTLTIGSADPATSSYSASPASVKANGTDSSTVTVVLKDVGGNQLATGGANITISSSLGEVSSVTDNANGTYSATVTSTSAGSGVISASIGTSPITGSSGVTIDFTSGTTTHKSLMVQLRFAPGSAALTRADHAQLIKLARRLTNGAFVRVIVWGPHNAKLAVARRNAIIHVFMTIVKLRIHVKLVTRTRANIARVITLVELT